MSSVMMTLGLSDSGLRRHPLRWYGPQVRTERSGTTTRASHADNRSWRGGDGGRGAVRLQSVCCERGRRWVVEPRRRHQGFGGWGGRRQLGREHQSHRPIENLPKHIVSLKISGHQWNIPNSANPLHTLSSRFSTQPLHAIAVKRLKRGTAVW